MIDITSKDIGQVVPKFDYASDDMLACVKWAFDLGFADGDLQSYSDFTTWLDSLDEDEWSAFMDMDIPFYIKNLIVVWVNENIPLGYRALWDWDNGIIIENGV